MFAIPRRDLYHAEYLSTFIKTDNCCYWIMRVDVSEEGQFVQENTRENSMVVLYEMPVYILEYRSNKLIITLNPADILLTEDWQPIRHIQAAVEGNIDKNYICRHPDFDEVKFPFLIISGYQF